jgi:transcriptional antiterminator NusG
MVEKKGKLTEKEEYIFKGYVLIEMIMTDESWFVIRNTPNVTGFVGSHGAGSKPAPLLPEEINSILRAMGQFVRTTELNVNIGDTIQIIEGAFANMSGQVIKVDYDKQKLKVAIEMFGRETNVDLEFSQADTLD